MSVPHLGHSSTVMSDHHDLGDIMGYSFAIAVTLPAYLIAATALVFGASWFMAFAILMSVTALGGLGLAAHLLSGDDSEEDGWTPRPT